MIDVGEHIEYLLSACDCVVVPGVGAFVAQNIPAALSSEDGSFHAPGRQVRFNPVLTHDDGLLVASLMRRHGLSREAALREIKQWASDDMMAVGRVGTLKTSPTPDLTPVFSAKPGSLATAFTESLPVLKKAEERPGALDEDSEKHHIDRLHLPRWTRYAAMLAGGLTLIGVTFLAPDIDMSSVAQARLFDRVTSWLPAKSQAEVLPDLVSKPVKLSIAVPVQEKESPVQPLIEAKPEMPYAVVVASFHTREEAMRHIADSHDPAMKYLGIGKFHRVIVAEESNYKDAYLLALKLDKQYPGAWALKK